MTSLELLLTLGVVSGAHADVALQCVDQGIQATKGSQALGHVVHQVGITDGHVGGLRAAQQGVCEASNHAFQ